MYKILYLIKNKNGGNIYNEEKQKNDIEKWKGFDNFIGNNNAIIFSSYDNRNVY